jgi:hypothetical protein
MSIEDTDTVDFISVSPDQRVVLSISDHLEWDSENRHLLQLQQKLNAYLRFIESGEMLEKYPDAAGRPITIQLVTLHEPDTTDAHEFLARVRRTLAQSGYSLIVKRNPGDPKTPRLAD